MYRVSILSPNKGSAYLMNVYDLEGGSMESLGKGALEVGAMVLQLAAGHTDEALNEVWCGRYLLFRRALGSLNFTRVIASSVTYHDHCLFSHASPYILRLGILYELSQWVVLVTTNTFVSC